MAVAGGWSAVMSLTAVAVATMGRVGTAVMRVWGWSERVQLSMAVLALMAAVRVGRVRASGGVGGAALKPGG